jgi:DNA-3-methyladenine glycosylase II
MQRGTLPKLAMRTIRTHIDLQEGVAALTRSCRHLARVHAAAGDPPLRRRPAGFKGLSRVIVGQQLSVASAQAIWGRLEALAHPFTTASFVKLSDRELRRTGLSAAKIATLRGIAAAIDDGSLDLEALSHVPEDVIHAKLTALKGVGPWTADIYILFCLARADAWSPGDLALKVAVKDALALETRPDQALMIEIAEFWRPWRAVAARMLWSYYALRRKRADAPA